MATIIGSLRPDATAGEKEVLNRLRELPADYLVWPELAVAGRHPDFVIAAPGRGVAVFEVKDWVEIVAANPQTFNIRTRGGEERNEENPIRGLRHKAFAITRRLESEPRLIHQSGPHYGKLRVPYAYAVIFPNLTDMFLWQLGPIFDDNRWAISRDRLQQCAALELIDSLNWGFRADLSADDMDVIRAAIFPELKIISGGREVGVMDQTQEHAAREALFERAAPPREELPEHGRRLAVNPVIRLVRGVAGSGKTLVLARRARYLSEANPDWHVLVVTFTRALAQTLRDQLGDDDPRLTVTHFHQLCTDLIDQELGDWGHGPVTDTVGTIARLLQDLPSMERLDSQFLAGEIAWMKDTGLTDERYLTAPRVGRRRPLLPADRQFVLDVYRRYQHNLGWRHRFDWMDVPITVANAIDAGALTGARYDAILIDEAQDFAPTWFGVLRRLLNPETGVMFLAADGAQRIYRQHSWRSLGLNVVGRARVLPRPYRMTYEIARAAAELMRGNPVVMEELAGEEDELLQRQPDSRWMRHGDHPELRLFANQAVEFKWLQNRLEDLRRDGYAPHEIAIFHRHTQSIDPYAGHLRKHKWPVRVLRADAPVEGDGITVGTMHAAKGLEFRAVFMPQLDMMFDKLGVTAEERRASVAAETRLLYVALTRARERAYLMHRGRLPEHLAHLARYLDEVREVNA